MSDSKTSHVGIDRIWIPNTFNGKLNILYKYNIEENSCTFLLF